MEDEMNGSDFWSCVEETQGRYAPIRSFRDLIVWQKAMQVVTLVYQQTADFPASERYGLVAQMRRSAVSVPSNVAEGYGRRSSGDYARFLSIARGSVYELSTHFDIACNLGFIKPARSGEVGEVLNEIERMLASLITKIEAHMSLPIEKNGRNHQRS